MILVSLQTLDHAPAQQSTSIGQNILMSQIALDSDKENMPPIESITPPSLKNLSLEEENNDNDEHEATSWEANVASKFRFAPQI